MITESIPTSSWTSSYRAPLREINAPISPVDATPEEIAQVVLRDKPKKKWRHMEGIKRQR